MRARRFGLVFLLIAVLLAGVNGAAGQATAQFDEEISALNQRVVVLINERKFGDALPLARHSIELSRTRQGEDHPQYAIALNNLAQILQRTNQLAEAEQLMRRALVIYERTLGPEHPDVTTGLNNLARLMQDTNRLAEAEPLMRRALAVDEKTLGPDHPNVANRLNNLATLLHDTNRLAEAEPLYRRALAIDEKSLGPEHPNVARDLNNLAEFLRKINRLAEAEPLYRRAVAIDEKHFGPEHLEVAIDLNNLANLLADTGRLAEADLLQRRVLAIFEKSLGPEHPNVAVSLNNLARLLHDANRLAEAEPLYRRSLAIHEKSFGPEHPSVAVNLNNIARVLQDTDRLTEAESLLRRALAIDEKSFGPDHPNVAFRVNNLAAVLQATSRFVEAEPLFRRALAIHEKSFGSQHPNVALGFNNLARLLQVTNRSAEAELLYRGALTIDQKSFGAEHRSVARDLNNLGLLRAELGDWVQAAQLHRRAKPIMTGARSRARESSSKATLSQNTRNLRASARAVHRSGGRRASAREEGFELAQWALQTGAADALAQTSVRFAKGAGPLSQLVREWQDLIALRLGEDKRLLAAAGAGDAKATEAIRKSIADLDSKLDAIDKNLATDFAEFASLASPKPLTIAAVQTLLRANEALVLFLDVPRFGQLPEETLAWTITKTDARWMSIPLGTTAFAERVAKLRCGLDREGQWAWSGRLWEAKNERCRALKPEGIGDSEPLPFDLGGAHELYVALLAPFADLTKGKHLIIVPSGPLTSLPFHVLVREAPKSATFRNAAWLALTQPITVLPSVGSLEALRKLPPSQAKEPYIGFGNPLLDGDARDTNHREWAREARARQSCSPELVTPRQRAAARNLPVLGAVVRGGGINLSALRAQTPLPETADELCRVAKALGALGREPETVWLGERATEANVKTVSRAGKLARYRVLHFATHGLLAGESEAILKAKAEPALILNPPKDGATPAELEEDDGLLTASEVAQLNLDADWVVLSACNTAAGDKSDAEALAGLARAFFYAKARALLVSHWYVDSEAGVKLTSRMFEELRARPNVGRAEALRRSMARLITAGRAEEAHPAYWAPFVLVGEGAGQVAR